MPGVQTVATLVLRICALRRFFSTFPSDSRGVGLLVLRVAAGLLAIAQGAAECASIRGAEILLPTVQIAVGVLLLAGFLTPVASTTLAVISLGIAFSWIAPAARPIQPFCNSLFVAAIAVSITLLGPGWLSIDARLFGRHRIIIPVTRK